MMTVQSDLAAALADVERSVCSLRRSDVRDDDALWASGRSLPIMANMHVCFAATKPVVPSSGRRLRSSVLAVLLLGALTVASPAGAADEKEEQKASASAGLDTKGGAASTGASAAGASAAALVGPADGDHIIFVEGGFRQDLGSFSRRDVVGEHVDVNRSDVDAFGPMFHVGFLERINGRTRLGGAFAYGGNYRTTGNTLLGQLLTLDLRVELGIPIAPKWAIIGTPRIGLSMLIPGGTLADRIQSNQLAGYDTWSGPRYGFIVGADVGARYGFTSWLSARATLGYAWHIMLLLNTRASDGEISASQSWTVQASRLAGNLGLEVAF